MKVIALIDGRFQEVETAGAESATRLAREFYDTILSAPATFIDVPTSSMRFTQRSGVDLFINGDYQDNITVPQAQRIVPAAPLEAGDVIAVVNYVTISDAVAPASSFVPFYVPPLEVFEVPENQQAVAVRRIRVDGRVILTGVLAEAR